MRLPPQLLRRFLISQFSTWSIHPRRYAARTSSSRTLVENSVPVNFHRTRGGPYFFGPTQNRSRMKINKRVDLSYCRRTICWRVKKNHLDHHGLCYCTAETSVKRTLVGNERLCPLHGDLKH